MEVIRNDLVLVLFFVSIDCSQWLRQISLTQDVWTMFWSCLLWPAVEPYQRYRQTI